MNQMRSRMRLIRGVSVVFHPRVDGRSDGRTVGWTDGMPGPKVHNGVAGGGSDSSIVGQLSGWVSGLPTQR